MKKYIIRVAATIAVVALLMYFVMPYVANLIMEVIR